MHFKVMLPVFWLKYNVNLCRRVITGKTQEQDKQKAQFQKRMYIPMATFKLGDQWSMGKLLFPCCQELWAYDGC